MGTKRASWLMAVVAAAGLVLVLAAFGALQFLGVDTSPAALCVSAQDADSDGGTIYRATRLWLPVIGASCTYAPSYDVHIQRIVFDWPASISAIAGLTLLATSAVWAGRKALRR